jgi:ribosomal protein S18 acetylase RimI-like enzyme
MSDHEPMAKVLTVRRLGPGDESLVIDAGHLFDDTPRPSWVARFLNEPTHHLLIAYRNNRAAGFVSAVEMTHPDKGTEMFLYELGVDESCRRRGIGKELVKRLASIARDRGCYDMWVLTDDANVAALGTYEAGGAIRDGDPQVMLTWHFQKGTTHR